MGLGADVGPSACVYQGAHADASTCARRMYFAALQAYLFQPLPRIALGAARAAAGRMAAEAARGAAVFAVHVRRGDAAQLGWRSSAGLEDYLRVAERGAVGVAGAQGAGGAALRPVLYLATDSAVVRARAGEACARAGFELLPPSPTSSTLLQGAGAQEVSAHTETFIAQTLAGAEGQATARRAPVPALARHNTSHSLQHALDAVQPLPALQDYLPPHLLQALGTGSAEAILSALAHGTELPAASAEATATALSVRALTDSVIADIYALSFGTHFVGSCLSQVSRVAYDLAYAAGRARAAPVGLDAGACRAHPVHFFPIAADWREGFDVWADG